MNEASFERFQHFAALAAALPTGDKRLEYHASTLLVGSKPQSVFAITAPTGEHLATLIELAAMAPEILDHVNALEAELVRLRAAAAPAVSAGG